MSSVVIAGDADCVCVSVYVRGSVYAGQGFCGCLVLLLVQVVVQGTESEGR